QIGGKELQDELIIKQDNSYINEKENKLQGEVVFQKTRLLKSNVIDILGEEGKLEVLKENGEVIYEVNKETEATEEGLIEINYEENLQNIYLKITQPKKLGTLKIEHTKVIPETIKN